MEVGVPRSAALVERRTQDSGDSPMALYHRLAVKITALSVFLVVVTIGFFAVVSYVREHQALQERFGFALERIVATAALQIDGDEHRQIWRAEDARGPAFARIRSLLRRVQEANGLREDLLYTFNIESESELRFAVMLQAVAYTGDRYRVVPQNLEPLRHTIRSGQASHTRLYQDENGQWVSAYAPIRDSRGQVVGILEADYDISAFERALSVEQRRLLLTSLGAVALAIGLSLFLGQNISRALQRIREGAERIEREDYDHRIALRRRDELGLVARQFNRMAQVLAERFHLLKFLPRYTREAVARRVRREAGPDLEQIEAAILFSDIRGYTSLSVGLSGEQLVRMLNIYLRRQAELIEEQGGTIDKFIGDAVLAVFTGEAHRERAVRAALAIQQAVAEMNAQAAFERPVHLGIGLAWGPLVLGEIGSAGRRERTILGSIVNLANRLCGQAAAGEVLLSAELAEAVASAFPALACRKLELKGFAGPQICYLAATSASAEA
jgi:class 3 adenylate cyclase